MTDVQTTRAAGAGDREWPTGLRLGMLTPSSNTTLEPVTAAMLADLDGVSVHFGRFRVTEIALSASALGQFEPTEILRAASLLADAKCQVIGWNGTSSGWLGFETDERLCRVITAQTGAKACTSVLALNERLAACGHRRFALVSPYTSDVQQRIVANYAAAGFTCVAERHLGLRDNFSFSRVSPAQIEAMVREVAASAPDAIVILCTNMAGAPLVPGLEAALGIPVYDSIATGGLEGAAAGRRRAGRAGSVGVPVRPRVRLTPATPILADAAQARYLPGGPVTTGAVLIDLAASGAGANAGSAELFWALFDALPVGAVLFDPDTDAFIAFNSAACRQLGYEADRFASLRVGDIDLLRSGPELVAARKALVPGAAPRRFRTRQRAADGQVREVEVTLQCVRIGERSMGYAVWLDVTEREATLARLREREAELARVQRVGKVGGFEVDLIDGFRKHRSTEYLRLHDTPGESPLETHAAWLERLHPDDRARADRNFRDAVEGDAREYASDYRMIAPDGAIRWISALAEIERDAGGRALRMIGAHIDVTSLKQAEMALADQAKRLQAQDRRKDEFLAMLGHELRNPMAAMLSVSERLKRSGAELPPDVVAAHGVIERHLAQLRVIVDDLLDVARIHTGRIVLRQDPVDLVDVVRSALEQTAVLTGSLGHRCVVSGIATPTRVTGDAARLTQVVTNLLSNAAKYTDPGGTIEIALRTAGDSGRADGPRYGHRHDGRAVAARLRPFRAVAAHPRSHDRRTRHRPDAGQGDRAAAWRTDRCPQRRSRHRQHAHGQPAARRGRCGADRTRSR